MADASDRAKFFNHQKLGLELKCTICLNLFNRPVLLPCDHIFCNVCIPKSTQFGFDCPVCKQKCVDRDVRSIPFLENIVAIYKSSDAAFSANLTQSVPSDRSKSVRTSENYTISHDTKLVNSVKMNEEELIDGTSSDSPVSSEGARIELAFQEVTLVPAVQSSPKNSPSCTDNGRDPVLSTNSNLENQSKRPLCNILNEVGASEENRSSSLESGAGYRTLKKPKTLNSGFSEVNADGNGTTQTKDFHSEGMGTCKPKVSPKIDGLSGEKTVGTSHFQSICVFCQKSEITDTTGPMMHYVNGKEVSADSVNKFNTNIIHVHKICLEWTPQAYFVGDTVKNLKPEVTRAAKLKCSSCGQKGAALGCLVTSCRRSYHVPCAANIKKCRWDFVNFLLLCPSHASDKFPSERSKLGNHSTEKTALPAEIDSNPPDFLAASPCHAKEWVFCGSALSAEDKLLMVKFAGTCGAKVSKFWGENVTHVIADTDVNGACSRTLKVLKAILNGRWVLTIDWIKASMKLKSPVDEELYEVKLDNHGCHGGPRAGRLRSLNNLPNLFDSCRFYFIGEFIPAYKKDLIELVIAGGGNVIEREEEFVMVVPSVEKSIVVYCSGETTIKGSSSSCRGAVMAEEFAAEMGSQASVPHTWLLESIAACQLQPLV
ncbi:BRCA1-associated RING domain protein 1 isoform X2 [Impatiens glandulifera]|uniref:BRCA1-associated RING domain protein 1 isoform X2 n=1 Tax=Impatiens glandulifera TaxID=253017 RepID=UPI001FB140E1|nr:BRCA1-associated RING domain protein 1 isoform X2 [Impatiens glandulifera]